MVENIDLWMVKMMKMDKIKCFHLKVSDQKLIPAMLSD